MSHTTLGIKVDPETRNRLKCAANKVDRSSHWIMKHAILDWLARIEQGAKISDLLDAESITHDEQRNSVTLRQKKTDCL